MEKAPARTLERRPPIAAAIKRGTPLYEQIYASLWHLIFKGEIAPGDRLSDRDWASRLNTSRTPVREAMRQMARDGVLTVLENGGYQVRSVDSNGLEQLYRCRAPLAALAAHETARRKDARLNKQIGDVVQSTKKAIEERDPRAALRLNSRFYELLVQGSGNPYLELITANLEKLIFFYRIALLKQSTGQAKHKDEYFKHLARGNDRLRQIGDAIASGDADKAGNLMLKHLLASAEDMARLLQPS